MFWMQMMDKRLPPVYDQEPKDLLQTQRGLVKGGLDLSIQAEPRSEEDELPPGLQPVRRNDRFSLRAQLHSD